MAINFVLLGGAVVSGHAATGQQLAFTQSPAGCATALTGGVAWPQACQPVVQVQDLTGSPIDSSDSITLSITPPTATQNGAKLVCSSGLTRFASNGTVAFNGCKIDKTGTYSLTATDNTTPGTTITNTFSIVAGPPAQLAVTGLANPSAAGASQTVTVSALDAGGNPAGSNYTGTVHFTSNDPAATLPANYTFVAGDASSHSFSGVVLKTAGSRSVTATDTGTSSITGTDGPVTVNPGPVASITISPLNATTTAGVPVAYTVTAWDGPSGTGNQIGDVTSQTTFSINHSGTCTGGSGTNGAAPGNNRCGDNTAESDSVMASFSGKSTTTTLTVNPGSGVLSFTAGPDASQPISNGGFEDPNGSGSLNGWTAAATGTAPTPAVSTAESYSGSHSAFLGGASGPIEPTGDSTLQQSFTVPAGSPTLTFLWLPRSAGTSGDFQQVTVTCGACAAAQNNVTVIKTLISDDQRWRPIQFDLSYAVGDTVDVIFDVHQSGGSTPSTAMYVDDVLVSSQAAGAPFATQPVVRVQDSNGNPITTYNGPVTLSIAPATGSPGATLSCDSNPVNAVSGVATFSGCKVDTTGYYYELTAAATSASAIANGTSKPFSASGAIIFFEGTPSDSTGGTAFQQQPSVWSYTNTGSLNGGDSSTVVTIGITPGTGAGGATLSCPAGYSKTMASGMATYSGCSIDKASASPYTLTATGVAADGTHAYPTVSKPFTISAGLTSHFAVSGLANPSVAGQTQTLTVQPEDAGGNAPSQAYPGAVYITFSPAGSGSSTPTSVAAGGCGMSCTFQVQLTTAGQDTVTASNSTSQPVVNGHQTVTVNPAGAASYQVTAPGSTTAGNAFNLGVTALDAYGNTATGYAGTAHFTSTDGAAALPADSTLSGGSGTFSVTLNTAGNQTVTATDTTTSSITGTSGAINVTPGSPASITVTPANQKTTAGTPVTYTVTAFDSHANSIGDVTSQATFNITPDGTCVGGTGTGGTAPGNNQCGAVTAGPHTVHASYAGQSASTGLTVNPGAVSSITISPQNAVTSPGSPVTYTATGYDSYGNSRGDVTGVTTFAITPSGSCASGANTTGPGNNVCGANSYGNFTVTGTYSPGVSASTTLTEDPGWAKLPGSARDLGAWNSNLDVIGTNPTGGGYGIYRYNGSGWNAFPGGGSRIAVGPSGNPVVINSSNAIYRWTGSFWQALPGSANDVAVGGSGSDQIFVIGTNATGGGYGIYRWNGSSWAAFPGGGVRIAVGPDGNPTIINSTGDIWHWDGANWQQLPGSAKDIGVGSDGSIWVIGTNATGGGFGIYKWTGGGFSAVPGGGVSISVGSNGLPVIINDVGDIYQRL